ncbi:MAG: hypothetical protein QOF61_2460, partial [Acidobacteriota bacterium]|nr:hypothetical protein [Acidobacteriota bacterium]
MSSRTSEKTLCPYCRAPVREGWTYCKQCRLNLTVPISAETLREAQ